LGYGGGFIIPPVQLLKEQSRKEISAYFDAARAFCIQIAECN